MKILIVEDERPIVRGIREYFSTQGVTCETACDTRQALEKISLYDYDCIFLDLMLPDGDGFDVLTQLRRQGKTDGVIITSAKEQLDTRLEGLRLGADDYLTKPFHLPELLVRMQALVRRRKFNGQNVLHFNEIAVDVMARTLTVHQRRVDVTKKELDLLLFLIGNQGKVLSKAAIAEHLSGDMADMLDNHDFIYAHIKNLKKKLAQAGCGDYIGTVYGLGYKWRHEN